MKKEMSVSTPFWRDKRIIPILLQLIFVFIVALFGAYFIINAINGLEKIGIAFGFSFLGQRAGFGITDSLIEYSSSDTYGRALFVGILNTLKVALFGIIFATIIGIIAGISRLSSNWLVSKLSSIYIEIFRNTPLLVQLFIWYYAVLLQLPLIDDVKTSSSFIFTNRGVAIPWFQQNSGSLVWTILLLIGIILSIIMWRVQLKRQIDLGKRTYPFIWGTGAIILAIVVSLIVTQQAPFDISNPSIEGRGFTGGSLLRPEFLALLLALSVYTSTYIAEIVRAGILGVKQGQKEAANALGLKPSTTMRLVVFPQAIRIIIPPVTSQYLNLIKNSSLGVAIAYQEIVSVGKTTLGQNSRAIEVVLIWIAVYLLINLITALIMNIFNKKAQIVER
ncbi:ABC transporter permease subunit [Bacillus sp. SM2101]|uniref:amino acid ABC transporter permease n=1 Tax=Bacillus sp. SM2101 TaxID=2805366 RepID=UPI001BDEC8C4|nr:ABC transporter permease subunit [Bacillus sp. SM2101]